MQVVVVVIVVVLDSFNPAEIAANKCVHLTNLWNFSVTGCAQ